MHKLRIVTVATSGKRSLTRPFCDARRFPPVPWATRTPQKFGIRPSFKGHFLSHRAKPYHYDSLPFHRCMVLERALEHSFEWPTAKAKAAKS
jgi:hypothetical protein